jgi:hypothetical protein
VHRRDGVDLALHLVMIFGDKVRGEKLNSAIRSCVGFD